MVALQAGRKHRVVVNSALSQGV
jgi:hypothetical protein